MGQLTDFPYEEIRNVQGDYFDTVQEAQDAGFEMDQIWSVTEGEMSLNEYNAQAGEGAGLSVEDLADSRAMSVEEFIEMYEVEADEIGDVATVSVFIYGGPEHFVNLIGFIATQERRGEDEVYEEALV